MKSHLIKAVRGIKHKYIEAMEQRGDVLPKKKRGQPLLLSDEMDREVQKYIHVEKRSVPITRNCSGERDCHEA